MSRPAIIFLSVIFPFMLSACEGREEPTVEKIRPLESIVITPEPARSLQLAGVVQARIQTELGFRVLGRVVKRNVDIGDLVTKGQVMATIDPLALQLAVRSGQADLSNAKAQLTNAVLDESRQRQLTQTNSTSAATYENAQQVRESAQAAVAKAEASLAKAAEQLSYAELRAEFDGVVTGVSVEAGQVLAAGETAFTVARPDRRDVVVDVPEDDAGGLKPGSRFDIRLQLDPGIQTSGIVREIAPEADATTRTSRVKITLDSPPIAFRLGTIVTATATTDASPTISVPASALLRQGTRTSVWIVDPQAKTVSRRDVEIAAATRDDMFFIRSGLKAGDRVAVAGVNRLKEGQEVRIDQEHML
jgi:RND family efflux transporter MFP subunit